MNIKISGCSLFLCIGMSACQNQVADGTNTVVVKNPSGGSAMMQRVEIPLDDKFKGWVLKDVPSEWVQNEEGNYQLYAQISIPAGQERSFTLVSPSNDQMQWPDHAHAELSVRTGGAWEEQVYKADGFSFESVEQFTSPPQLTDHSYYLRYEGPGWENDKVGYRLYLDWRNAIDVFAKTSSQVALPQAGQDGYDSYHELASWGGDALKVGKSLGVGALGRVFGDKIMHFQHVDTTSWELQHNGSQFATFDVDYTNWRTQENSDDGIDITTSYTINAGDPSTQISVSTSKPTEGIVAGLVAHSGMAVIDQTYGNWGVIATWGEQSVLSDGDKLGLALFYPLSQVQSVTKGEFDHLVQFKPSSNFEYYIMAAWPGHTDNIEDQAKFSDLITEKLKALNTPIIVHEVSLNN